MTGPANPWEQRAKAIAAGFDPYSVTAASARRRMGDAGHGRSVVVPAYVGRTGSDGEPRTTGMLVRLAPGGGLTLDVGAFPADLGDPTRFWLGVHRASAEPQALAHRDDWVRVTVGPAGSARPEPGTVALVLRATDWSMLRSALDLRHKPASGLQDAPTEHVLRHYLGRLDGEDGTPSAGLWGRLALEAVSRRIPGRLADTRSLRWQASWGEGGFPAGSGGRAVGWADSPMLLDLRHHRVTLARGPFRVRTLPEWEREQAAHDLGLATRRLLAWPVAPLADLLGLFVDIAPAPDPASGTRSGSGSRSGSGPQDAPTTPPPRDAP